ncbi:response regulator [Acidihalobacter ferrooxydans]|uniref:Two-component system response regulator n=1 Tax=Acidihalobacter ferrooxydans TaxID=1765967 RepID=A0A1P8UK65_9GAMM|nr:response regulator [Acidihalobacter ferrooxydans]APZ44217.1 two-component system response regulator [Acidihalobacter ferrooxydans]
MTDILVVDDSPTELHVIKGMLEKHGFQVFSAQNGEEGVKIARNVKPDLILMDVVMPGLNGFQATRQLAKMPETASIPVIMVTTKDQETDKVWAMRQGAKDYIVKPPREKDLIERVNGLLRA